MKFYKVKHNPEIIKTDYGYVMLFCEGTHKVTEVWLEPFHERICTKHFLYHAKEVCDKQYDLRLEDYFFTTAPSYKNQTENIYLIEPIPQLAGDYFPRIYRPVLHRTDSMNGVSFNPSNKILTGPFYSNDYFPCNENTLIRSVQQLNTLIDRLKTIFVNVYPTESNYTSFGHEIRNLLILSCTEVESQLKGILQENNISSANANYTTRDYVKLKSVLGLDRYTIRFPYYPEINPVSPFKEWNSANPTQSIFWYDNYNAVKHNNENEFHKATLFSTINAVSAVCVLLVSQYGANMPYWTDLVGGFFDIVESPTWTFDDCYLPPFKGNNWTPKNFQLV
jgi:hypothetical protein